MLIDEYITYVKEVRRYSPRTCELYRDILDGFARFCDQDVLESLNPSMIRSYEVHLLDKKKEDPRTVNLHLSVLSGFCR